MQPLMRWSTPPAGGDGSKPPQVRGWRGRSRNLGGRGLRARRTDDPMTKADAGGSGGGGGEGLGGANGGLAASSPGGHASAGCIPVDGRISGSTASARAVPTRCFMPPESSRGYASSKPVRPTRCTTFSTGARTSAGFIPRASSAPPMFSATVSHEYSKKLWNSIASPGFSAGIGLQLGATFLTRR